MQPDWNKNDLVVHDTHFNYYRTPGTHGSGKPALVLQHGFTDNGLCWGPVAEALAADYDIIMPDARGHGHSARVVTGEAIDQAADLAGLLRALDVKQAVVAGHSMGAAMAADLAARFPELVRAIVLEDPPWFPPRPESGPSATSAGSAIGQWLLTLQDKSLDQIIEACRQEHPTWPEPYLRAWCQGKKELDLNFLLRPVQPSHWQECVQAIRCPALLITAEPGLGSLVTPEVARQVMEMNPNFRVINFPGVGHHVRFATHEAYMQAFKTFLAEVS